MFEKSYQTHQVVNFRWINGCFRKLPVKFNLLSPSQSIDLELFQVGNKFLLKVLLTGRVR